jgi:4'-phosphopantetheinyl transferase
MLSVASVMFNREFLPCPLGTWPYDRSDNASHIRIWRMSCDRIDLQSAWDVLTDAERIRGARFARAVDQSNFTVTRAELRRILAGELGVEARAVTLAEPPLGKPRLCAGHRRPDIDFSVSHTDGLSIIALVHQGIVGVDVERCRVVPESVCIARDVFGNDVARSISALPPRKRDEAFLRLWTAGEAFVKAAGTGLAQRRTPIPLRIRRDDLHVEFCPDFPEADAWRLTFIDVPAGYVCCLATAGAGRAPRMVRS